MFQTLCVLIINKNHFCFGTVAYLVRQYYSLMSCLKAHVNCSQRQKGLLKEVSTRPLLIPNLFHLELSPTQLILSLARKKKILVQAWTNSYTTANRLNNWHSRLVFLKYYFNIYVKVRRGKGRKGGVRAVSVFP